MTQQNKKMDKKAIITLASVLLFLILCIFGVIALFNSDDSNSDDLESYDDIPGESELSYEGKLEGIDLTEEQKKQQESDYSINLDFDDVNFEEEEEEQKEEEIIEEEPVTKKRSYTGSSRSSKSTTYSKRSHPITEEKESTIKEEQKEDPFARDDFYSASEHDVPSDDANELNTKEVKAITNGSYKVSPQSVVKFRLQEDVFINGTRKPSGTIIYGTVSSISNNRIKFNLTSSGFSSAELHDHKGGEGIITEGNEVNQNITEGHADDVLDDIGGRTNKVRELIRSAKEKLKDNSVPIIDHYDVIIKF